MSLITFHDTLAEAYPYLDVVSDDRNVQPSGPGVASLDLPERITEKCDVSLERAFHRLVLRTSCPGKPHLIKYNYYPKWTSEVPIRLGTNGFMVLTPKDETTVLEHRNGFADHLGVGLSLAGLVLMLWPIRTRHGHPLA